MSLSTLPTDILIDEISHYLTTHDILSLSKVSKSLFESVSLNKILGSKSPKYYKLFNDYEEYAEYEDYYIYYRAIITELLFIYDKYGTINYTDLFSYSCRFIHLPKFLLKCIHAPSLFRRYESLNEAAKYGNIEMIKLILRLNKRKIWAQNETLMNYSLYYAVSYNQIEAFKILYQDYMLYNTTDQILCHKLYLPICYLYHYAINHLDMIKFLYSIPLVETGIDERFIDELIKLTVYTKNIEIIKFILTRYGHKIQDAFRIICLNGLDDLFEDFIKEWEITNPHVYFDLVLDYNQSKIVKLFLEHFPNKKLKLNLTHLYKARDKKYDDIVQELLKHM